MSETQSGSGDGAGRTAHTDRTADVTAKTGMTWYEQDVSAQEYNGSVRTVWPQPWARAAGVEHKTDVAAVVHMSTGAMVSLPPGLSIGEFLSTVQR